jgi:hypothetical protein
MNTVVPDGSGSSLLLQGQTRNKLGREVMVMSLSQTFTMPSALFQSTSPYKPSLLTISFAEDPAGSLGTQLNNRDNVRRDVLRTCVIVTGWCWPFRIFLTTN